VAVSDAPDPERLPSFSVVIPSHRGPGRLRACLEALAVQDYPRERFEVVVVDDGSSVSPAPLVSELGDRLRIQVHEQQNSGPAVARNAGAHVATGDVLAFTDDDCRPAPDWLRSLAEALGAHPTALVGGTVANGLPDDRFAEATQSLIGFLQRAYGDSSERRFFTSNNIAVARETFVAAGGFDESFPVPGGEDRELCERWHAQGRPMVAARPAVVLHDHAMTFRSFVRQHRDYGRGAFELHGRRRVASARARAESPGFYLRLVADPFRRRRFAPALAESALLAVTQVATAAGYLDERRRSRA
jgi:glycosyltransferase involved in cell wall biosynthesis